MTSQILESYLYPNSSFWEKQAHILVIRLWVTIEQNNIKLLTSIYNNNIWPDTKVGCFFIKILHWF